MKKLFVISILVVASIAFAAAQQGQGRSQGTPEERAKRAVERLTEALSLTADQKKKVEAIELDLYKQMETKMQKAETDEARRNVYQEISKLREEKYKTVLTADQFKKYQESAAQMRQRGQGQGGQGQGGSQGQGQRQRTN